MLLHDCPLNPPAKDPAPTIIGPHAREAVPPVGIANAAQIQSTVEPVITADAKAPPTTPPAKPLGKVEYSYDRESRHYQ